MELEHLTKVKGHSFEDIVQILKDKSITYEVIKEEPFSLRSNEGILGEHQ
jgi:hypothetical protein